jgi:hypothetical protein
MYPEVLQTILARESVYFTLVTKLDEELVEVYNRQGRAAAISALTQFSSDLGNQLVTDWASYFGQLFVKYRDGYVFTPNESSTNCGCNVGNGAYPQAWYDRIVEDTGDHYKVTDSVGCHHCVLYGLLCVHRFLPIPLRPATSLVSLVNLNISQ